MKKITIIILIVIIGFVIWKREPWIKTYSTKAECESKNKGVSCQMWKCDLVQTTFWLDCPHGGSFWKPMYYYTQ